MDELGVRTFSWKNHAANPYNELPESEKEHDRVTAMETIKAIIALGYRIQKD